MKVFISYAFDHENSGNSDYEWFAHRLTYYLRKQSELDPYCYSEARTKTNWNYLVGPKVKECDKFVLIVGKRWGGSQDDEAEAFRSKHPSGFVGKEAVCIALPGAVSIPDSLFQIHKKIEVPELNDQETQKCAYQIVEYFLGSNQWIADDGVPIGYPFDYEKVIIEEFVEGKGVLSTPRRVEQGCPRYWPKVQKVPLSPLSQALENPADEDRLGIFRSPDAIVRIDTPGLAPPEFLSAGVNPLAFLEAGPRKHLLYPTGTLLRVGIVVSGGIAPGINAVIAGIVERHRLYEVEQEERHRREHSISAQYGPRYSVDLVMYRDGFPGLLRGKKDSYSGERLRNLNVREWADRGGSKTGTARCDDLLGLADRKKRNEVLERVVNHILTDHIDILYVIGGDGSMRAAHAIWSRANIRVQAQQGRPLSVVGIPKTTDNDLLWVWQSFGFLSAVEKAKEMVLQLHTEVTSNPRLCVMQLFGSDSGFVVSHVALASGVCTAALMPEVEFSIGGLSRYIRARLDEQNRRSQVESPHGLILMAETAIPQDVEDYIDNPAYPDLGLEEKEKEAIRRFVGSSLLKISDICNWQGLCEAFLQGAEAKKTQDPVMWVWELLPKEVRGLIQYSDQLLQQEASLQALIIKALNDVLKRVDFCQHVSKQSAMANLFSAVLRLDDTHHPLTNAEFTKLDEDISMQPLSYDARGLLRRKREGDTLSSLEKQRLSQRCIETLSRLLLESIFPGLIAKIQPTFGDRRVNGQTPDELRTGGLKIVSRVLQADIRNPNLLFDSYWRDFRVFTNEPRHLLRAIAPNAPDVVFGHRLGTLAVDNAMAGYTDFMVSQWTTEYVLVPLELAVLGRKRVPEKGIFWKSVLANTGQPARM